MQGTTMASLAWPWDPMEPTDEPLREEGPQVPLLSPHQAGTDDGGRVAQPPADPPPSSLSGPRMRVQTLALVLRGYLQDVFNADAVLLNCRQVQRLVPPRDAPFGTKPEYNQLPEGY